MSMSITHDKLSAYGSPSTCSAEVELNPEDPGQDPAALQRSGRGNGQPIGQRAGGR